MDPELNAIEKLIYLNHELFAMIDGGISIDLLTRLLARRDESVREALLDEVCDLLSELTMIPLSGFRVPISDTAAMIEFIGCGIVGMMIQSRRWEISSPALLDERLRSVLAHIRTA
jgi:hypothetical protein